MDFSTHPILRRLLQKLLLADHLCSQGTGKLANSRWVKKIWRVFDESCFLVRGARGKKGRVHFGVYVGKGLEEEGVGEDVEVWIQP